MAVVCTVLVIEPSDLFRDFLDVVVEHAGYDVVAVDLGEMAQQALAQQHFDVVILASSGLGGRTDPLLLARRAADAGAGVIIVLDDIAYRRAFAEGRLPNDREAIHAEQADRSARAVASSQRHRLRAAAVARLAVEVLRHCLSAPCRQQRPAGANPLSPLRRGASAMKYRPRSRTCRRAPRPWRRQRGRAA